MHVTTVKYFCTSVAKQYWTKMTINLGDYAISKGVFRTGIGSEWECVADQG